MGLYRVGHDWSNLAAAAAAALGSNRFHVPLFLNNLPIPSLFSQWHALCSAYNLSLAISCLLLTYSQTSHFLFGHLFPVLRTIIILVVYYNTELLSSASERQRSKLGQQSCVHLKGLVEKPWPFPTSWGCLCSSVPGRHHCDSASLPTSPQTLPVFLLVRTPWLYWTHPDNPGGSP